MVFLVNCEDYILVPDCLQAFEFNILSLFYLINNNYRLIYLDLPEV